MRTEAFITALENVRENDPERFEKIMKNLPLGGDDDGRIVVARENDRNGRANHLCVTGSCRGEFIRRVLVTLAALYGKKNFCALVLSPDENYARLLSLQCADITVPYVRSKEDIDGGLAVLKSLIAMRKENGAKKYPRLVVVLDGLETLSDDDGQLKAYKPFFESTVKTGIDVITGVDLLKSIYSGYPGAFVDIGNCLVTADGVGKTDVTYVGDDSALSLPTALNYPSEPTLLETVEELNAKGNA